MEKAFKIKKCSQCPFCEAKWNGLYFYPNLYYICKKLGKEAFKTTIRKDCPLRGDTFILIFPERK